MSERLTPAAVDVVVLTWNDGALLTEAVNSALASEGVDVTVIVVDNGSENPPALPADERIRTISNGANVGVSRGRNQGVQAGRSPFVCLLDSDARLHPSALRTMVEQLEDERVALVAPVMTSQRPEASAGRAPSVGRKLARGLNLTSLYAPGSRAQGTAAWDVDFAIGACQLIRRSAFDAVGGLDETYFYGPEDVDFCLRLKGSGWRVVQVPDARCDHPPRRRFKKVLTRRGMAHAAAVARHLWKHRRYGRAASGSPVRWQPSTPS